MSPRVSVPGIPAYALFQSTPVLVPDPVAVTAWQAAKAIQLENQKNIKTVDTALKNLRVRSDAVIFSFVNTIFPFSDWDAKDCSLLVTEGEATGVSVARGVG